MGHLNLAMKHAGITASIKAPVVSSVSPASDPAAGGDAVTIHGKHFTHSTVPAVTFGGVAATSVVVTSEKTITCVTPAHGAGAVDVVVTYANKGDGHGLSGTGAGVFTYT